MNDRSVVLKNCFVEPGARLRHPANGIEDEIGKTSDGPSDGKACNRPQNDY